MNRTGLGFGRERIRKSPLQAQPKNLQRNPPFPVTVRDLPYRTVGNINFTTEKVSRR
jgi:hypothetical protein